MLIYYWHSAPTSFLHIDKICHIISLLYVPNCITPEITLLELLWRALEGSAQGAVAFIMAQSCRRNFHNKKKWQQHFQRKVKSKATIQITCTCRYSNNNVHVCKQSFWDLKNPFPAHLNSSSSFQVLLDFRGKWIIKSGQFLIEFHVAFIDVINVCFIMMSSATAVLFSFLNLFF